MNHVVRSAAGDIFEAIDQAPDREFLLRLTAVEIYNEKVQTAGLAFVNAGPPPPPGARHPTPVLCLNWSWRWWWEMGHKRGKGRTQAANPDDLTTQTMHKPMCRERNIYSSCSVMSMSPRGGPTAYVLYSSAI